MFPKVIAIILIVVGLLSFVGAAVGAAADPRGYLKPWDFSLTWWGGVAAVAIGVIILAAQRLGYLAVAVLAVAIGAGLAASPAIAAEGASVAIPIGDWIGAIIGDVASVLLALASYVVARWAPPLVKTFLTEQLLERAKDYAVAAVEGAAKGKVLTVPVANRVLAEAANYAVEHAPGTAKWLGDTLRPKLIARLSAAGMLPDDAHAGNLKG